MEEQKIMTENNQSRGFSLSEFIAIIRRRLALILAIVILATVGGVVFAYMQAPSYTAVRKITITVRSSDVGLDGTKNNVNSMVAYIDTIIDFCDEGVVLDRANYYFTEYENAKDVGNCEDVDDFLVKLQMGLIKDVYNANVHASDVQNVKSDDLMVSKLGDEMETQFAFTVKYTDGNRQLAYDKAILVVYAFKQELKLETNETGINEMKYFGGVTVNANDLGSLGVGSNTSKTRTVLIFILVGVVLGVVVAYVIHLLDNTVTGKHELEKLTGAPILSCVDN